MNRGSGTAAEDEFSTLTGCSALVMLSQRLVSQVWGRWRGFSTEIAGSLFLGAAFLQVVGWILFGVQTAGGELTAPGRCKTEYTVP